MRDISLTVQQGQHFLNYTSSGLRMPEVVGTDKYDVAERSWIDHKLLALKDLIFSYSSRVKAPRGVLFGGGELWEIQKSAACDKCGQQNSNWVMVDDEAEIKIRLTQDSEEGIYWALYLMAHPASPAAAGMGVLSSTVWPIARAMGIDKMLAKDIGLSGKRPRQILSNDEMEKAEKKPEVK